MYMCTLIVSGVYYNAQNTLHLYVHLVQTTAFGCAHASCLIFLKLILRWFWSSTDCSPLFYPNFSCSSNESNQQYKIIQSLHICSQILKMGSKVINHPDIHDSPIYIVRNQSSKIGTTDKVSDIQRISLWVIRPVNQILKVASH